MLSKHLHAASMALTLVIITAPCMMAAAQPDTPSTAAATPNSLTRSDSLASPDSLTSPSLASPDSLSSPSLASPDSLTSPEPVRSISLPACFAKSDRVNREILSATWNLAIARANVRIAGAVPNLQLSVQTGFGNSFQYVFDGQTQDYFLTQEFQTAGKRSKKLAVARANYGLAELQLDALRFDVHNRVRRAYAELAAAEAYEALINSQREVGLKLLNIAQRRFEAGKAAKAEVLQADLNILQYDTQMNQAQGRLQQATAALTQIIGEKPEHVEVIDVQDNGIFKLSAETTEIVPQPNRSLPLLAKLLDTAYYSRPDLKAAQQQVYANSKALILAKTKKIPDLFLGVGGTYSTFTRNQPAGLIATGNWIGTGVFINVTIENPVFYQYQGEVQVALGNVRQSERRVDLQRAQIATDLVTAYNEVKVARANIFEYQKNLLPTASDVARIARRGYEVGATDLATAIVAQQQYQQTLSNYFDSVVAYQTAWADMERAVGVPLRL
jgi:outer membrane protein, heavy metal efflux system